MFPEAADNYKATYKLPFKVTPILMIQSSDTGMSSLIVRGGYMTEGGSIVITDEYSRRHTGEINEEEILQNAQEVILNFPKIPQALVEKMGNVIGDGNDLTKDIGKKRNRRDVECAIKALFKKLELKKILGIKRGPKLRDQMIAEINPALVYTECDLALLFMGLPGRIPDLPKDVATRFAKACGKAPLIDIMDLKPDEEEDLVLLPEE